MKKFITIFLAIFLISDLSYATGAFVGADLLFSDARHKSDTMAKASQESYGFNVGGRFDFLPLLASGELFYDNLNSSSNAFASSGDVIKLRDRYGAKVNAGFAVLPRVTPFLTLGLSNVNYRINGIASNSRNEFTPLYGVGILFDLPLGISLKAAYDYQQYYFRSPNNPAKVRTDLGVARIGVVYNF